MPQKGTPKLLIVDDEPAIRETMAMLFELDGYEVLTAENGEQAFTLVQNKDFDAVISDIRMPVCSGLEFLDRLKTLPRTPPAVFLISAYSDVTRQECLARGAAAVFSKPFVHDELSAAVKKKLDTGH